MSDLETRLLEYWKADAEVWRARMGLVAQLHTSHDDDTTLGAADDSRMYETWAERKARKAAEPFGSNERIGQRRILEVLEKIGTPDAMRHVREVAGGAPGTQLTLAAQATLSRMEAKGAAKD